MWENVTNNVKMNTTTVDATHSFRHQLFLTSVLNDTFNSIDQSTWTHLINMRMYH